MDIVLILLRAEGMKVDRPSPRTFSLSKSLEISRNLSNSPRLCLSRTLSRGSERPEKSGEFGEVEGLVGER
eukprot:335680-Amorphochlora_amoeboformis.AAC.1